MIRWTIGDARDRGFEMLRLSIASAFRMFGWSARYVVCVNSISTSEAQERTGPLPVSVAWLQVHPADPARLLQRRLDREGIGGTGWKLYPLRIDSSRYELALDNDCFLWRVPEGMMRWLQSDNGFLFAEDVERCLGSFDRLCPPGAFNSGIRGLPPGEKFEEALHEVLQQVTKSSHGRLHLTSETEEQGLQAAAICRLQPLFWVKTTEVSICSPFWPRSSELGTCGAHFVGMNASHIPWDYYDRPADLWLEEHWKRHRPALYERAGILPEEEFDQAAL
jgi:hypothetical protein